MALREKDPERGKRCYGCNEVMIKKWRERKRLKEQKER